MPIKGQWVETYFETLPVETQKNLSIFISTITDEDFLDGITAQAESLKQFTESGFSHIVTFIGNIANIFMPLLRPIIGLTTQVGAGTAVSIQNLMKEIIELFENPTVQDGMKGFIGILNGIIAIFNKMVELFNALPQGVATFGRAVASTEPDAVTLDPEAPPVYNLFEILFGLLQRSFDMRWT